MDVPAILHLVLEEAQLIGVRLREQRDDIARSCRHSRAAWQILEVAVVSDLSVAQLARQLRQTRQGVQRVADQLVERGLATYKSNPNHKRSPLLQLNENGRAALRTLEREAASRAPDIEQDLESEDLETALYVLRALREVL